jgi:hypothetical protein
LFIVIVTSLHPIPLVAHSDNRARSAADRPDRFPREMREKKFYFGRSRSAKFVNIMLGVLS